MGRQAYRKQAEQLTYIRHTPSRPLNDYIAHLYYIDGAMPYPRERILPVPLLDLKINLGGPFQVYDPAGRLQTLTESWFVGLQGVHHHVEWPHDMRLYGIRFKPAGAHAFLGLPMSELHNRVVPLDAVWGNFAAEVRERLSAAPTIQAGLALFEQLIAGRFCGKPQEQDVLEYGIAAISRHHGTISIRDLCDRVGFSQNHLGTQFKRVVGTSMKELARLYRFEHVLRSVQRAQSVDWTQLAHRAGYYDQSHLNKDFAAFAGVNPGSYLTLRRRVYTVDAPIDQLSLRSLPTD